MIDKVKIRLIDGRSKICINCQSEEEAKKVLAYYAMRGITWSDGQFINDLTFWRYHGKHTCYYLKSGMIQMCSAEKIPKGRRIVDFNDIVFPSQENRLLITDIPDLAAIYVRGIAPRYELIRQWCKLKHIFVNYRYLVELSCSLGRNCCFYQVENRLNYCSLEYARKKNFEIYDFTDIRY